MTEEYSRRQHQHTTPSSSSHMIIVILLLVVNTLTLIFLISGNAQARESQTKQLENIEKRIDSLAQGADRQQRTLSTSTIESKTASQSTAQESTNTASSSQNSQEKTDSSHTESSDIQVTTYTVQAGDTLSTIADKNNISLQDLVAKNSLSDYTVYVGQVLILQ